MDSSRRLQRSYSASRQISKLWHKTLSFLKSSIITLWLFTVNDFKTTIFPNIAFAVFYSLGNLASQISVFVLLSRLPYVFCWTWVNLLAFTVNNQRYPGAITEDLLNKPWRPIPAGRISSRDAQILGLLTYPLSMWTSFLVGGGLIQSILLAVFGWVYNRPGASSRGFVVRNLLNGLGFTSFASGALDVTLERHHHGNSVLLDGNVLSWLCLLVVVILTTVHSQDLYDQAGDAASGRRTVPLVVGDSPARWSIALGVIWWSIVSARYWSSGSVGYQLTGSLALWVAWRTLFMRTVTADRTTFLIYNGWLMSVYSLPLAARCKAFTSN
ncbi:UbiA prenyltransferase family [Xylaria flabelliformis]|nr:UbiA prenyltransferase family [Xylaria flabelliformis]